MGYSLLAEVQTLAMLDWKIVSAGCKYIFKDTLRIVNTVGLWASSREHAIGDLPAELAELSFYVSAPGAINLRVLMPGVEQNVSRETLHPSATIKYNLSAYARFYAFRKSSFTCLNFRTRILAGCIIACMIFQTYSSEFKS